MLTRAEKFGVAFGEVQWTNGYRCGTFGTQKDFDTEEQKLYQREMAQWKFVDVERKALVMALLAFERAVRKAAK